MDAINRQRARRYRWELIMYRARADAVSGTKVFADGKWLQCIGNKNVSVGEYIWTDGRCVYGHFQESEQPQVITAPQEEGIPIILGNELYTFEKNRLKRVAKISFDGDKVNFYKDVAGKLIFVDTMPDTDKWTDFSLMINDHKQNAFLYDAGTHYKAGFYNSTNWSNAENNFYTDTKLIASNIDKAGNRFDMVIRYKSEWIEDDGEREKEIQETSVKILKNGQVVKSVDLQSIFNETENACPDAEQVWEPESFNAYWLTIEHTIGGGAFIEDEKNWCFWILGACTKETRFNDDPHVDSEITGWHAFSLFDRNHLKRIYLVKPAGHSVASETIRRFEKDRDIGMAVPTNTEKKSYSVTFPIQDRHYCTADNWQDYRDLSNDEEDTDTTTPFRNIAHITFHTPRGEELFTGTFLMPISFPFCRVKRKYLLGVSSEVFPDDIDEDEVSGVPVFNIGLYLGAGTQWENISPGKVLLNQRLRPMKKIRGWQNRIQLIELDQDEI